MIVLGFFLLLVVVDTILWVVQKAVGMVHRGT